jgi:hypothetical protein
MVKASSAVSLRSSPPVSCLSVQEASAALLALINSRPASPRLEEISAIIERTVGAVAKSAQRNGDLAEWCDMVSRYLNGSNEDEERTAQSEDALEEALCATTEGIWARPVHTWDDLVVRAAIAVHWNSPDYDTDPAYPDDIVRVAIADNGRGYDDYALAHVVRGVLDLAGLTFDSDGRLLSGPNKVDAIAGNPADADAEPPTFEALQVTFDYTNKQFADRYLPSVRIAFAMLQRDHIAATMVIHKLHDDEEAMQELMDTMEDWEVVSKQFSALSEFMQTARARTIVAIAHAERDRSPG